MEINKEHELVLLSKVLNVIRYHIIDEEASYLALSQITIDLHKRVVEELSAFADQRGVFLEKGIYIEKMPDKLEAIKYHIKNVEKWNSLDYVVKETVVKSLVSPYKMEDDTFYMLIKLLN